MISEILKRIFYPDDFGCIVCSRRARTYKEHSGAAICDECIKTFLKADGFLCTKCGRKVGSEDSLCKMCAKNDFAFEKAASVYVYEGSVRTVVHKLKYSGEECLANFAAAEMSKKYETLGWNCDFITFVPMYRAKERARGYNQAELLARNVAENTGIECLPALLRTKNTTPQSYLDTAERMANLTGAIKVFEEYKNKIENKRILVIDDILTTGSSLNECAKALIGAGAEKVYGLCMCSVSD